MFEFLNNNSPFVTYSSVEDPVTEYSLPLGSVKLSDGLSVGSNGKIQINNTPIKLNEENDRYNVIVDNTEEIPIEKNNPTMSNNISQNLKKAMEFFKSKGLSDYIAAGIVGNLILESNLNTSIKGDGGKAFGIALWHPDRQKGLKDLASKNKTDISDFNTLLEYIWLELNSSHKEALNKLLKSLNVELATNIFMSEYERPNKNPNINKIFNRIKYARSLLY